MPDTVKRGNVDIGRIVRAAMQEGRREGYLAGFIEGLTLEPGLEPTPAQAAIAYRWYEDWNRERQRRNRPKTETPIDT